MDISIKLQGTYGPDAGYAAGQAFGQVTGSANGRGCTLCLGRSADLPDVYLFRWWASGGSDPLDIDCRSGSICLAMPFEQAAMVIAGLMLRPQQTSIVRHLATS